MSYQKEQIDVILPHVSMCDSSSGARTDLFSYHSSSIRIYIYLISKTMKYWVFFCLFSNKYIVINIIITQNKNNILIHQSD